MCLTNAILCGWMIHVIITSDCLSVRWKNILNISWIVGEQVYKGYEKIQYIYIYLYLLYILPLSDYTATQK
jgi:hypothetical protein